MVVLQHEPYDNFINNKANIRYIIIKQFMVIPGFPDLTLRFFRHLLFNLFL